MVASYMATHLMHFVKFGQPMSTDKPYDVKSLKTSLPGYHALHLE